MSSAIEMLAETMFFTFSDLIPDIYICIFSSPFSGSAKNTQSLDNTVRKEMAGVAERFVNTVRELSESPGVLFYIIKQFSSLL